MAQKYELIYGLYEQTIGQITATQSAWQSFLRSACRNYKCRFDEQVLIYAQRPDAAAVLEIERWNKQFGRWVNAGATGIAVFDKQADKRPRLKHYFDISDTHESRSARPVPVWEMQPVYHAEVIETLEASFGALHDSSTLSAAIRSAVTNAVEDNHQAYLQQLLNVTADSFLEGMDEDAVTHFFKEALGGAAAYMLLVRCGENTNNILSPASFSPAMQFNTPDTLTLLGTATSDVAETMLREIARTIFSIETREKNTIHTLAKENQTEYAVPNIPQTPQSERSFEHGNHIQNARRLSPAQPSAATGGGSGHREIRTDAQEILGGKSQGNVRDFADAGHAVQPFSGDKHTGEAADTAADAGHDGGAGRDGAAESERPNEMGGAREQHQERSGGNRSERADLRLEPKQEADSPQLPASFHPTENTEIDTDIKPLRTPQEQVSFFDENYTIYTVDTQQLTLFKGFSITPEITDTVLRLGSTDPKSKRRICAYFAKDKPLVENIRLLKQEYKTGGEGVVLEGHKVSVWYDETGISIAEGESAQRISHTLVPWETAAKRIKELLTQGQYISQEEIDDAPRLERSEIANMLIFTWRDIELPADDAPLLATVGEVYKNTRGFPDTCNAVAALLQQPDILARLIDEYKTYAAAYEANPDIVRFRFYRPQEKNLQRLLDLQIAPLTFISSQIFPPPIERFITRDEIDAAITGSHERQSDERLATYSYFVNNRTPQARATYLRKRQIYSGGSWGPNGHIEKQSKGFRISRGGYTEADATVQLTWSKVQQRIAELMAQDKYLCDADHADMPQYEKHEIARQLHSGFSNHMYGEQNVQLFDSDYYKSVPKIEQQLDNPEKTQELQQLLLPIYESTAPDDRYYEMRKKGVAMIHSYTNGTFSLFGKRGEPTVLTAMEQAPITAEEAAQQAQQLAARIGELYEELGVSLKKRREPSDLLRDLNTPKSLEKLMDTLSSAAARLGDDADTTELDALLEDLQAFSELEVAPATAIAAPTQSSGTADIAQTITAQLEKVSDAAEYPAFSADVKALLREKNGDGLIPIIALNWLKKLASFSDEALREYVQAYEAGTLNALREANDLRAEDTQTEPEKSISAPTRAKVREHITFTPLHPEIPAEQRRNFRITDAQLGVGTPTEKYNANVTAIRLLQAIKAENRLATPEEQAILSRYVGWGGLANCFEETHPKYAELKSLLTEEEYAAARESTLTAFYTPPVVIEAIYKALAQMSFTAGNVLDPACGVGNFFGMLPESMNGAKLYGVELDSISGRIAKQLYQNGSIIVNGYEKTQMPDSFFDVAVGNVPFGDFKVLERRYDKYNWLIHDFFFGKTLDKVRPGGVVAFVTSKGTLDKKNGALRKYLAQRADLIGAIRLPNNTFKKNAGTEVTSDIIFLQKRDRMVEKEPDWVHLDTDRYDVTMNQYFVQHPEMVLGTMEMVSGPFGMESTCKPYEDADLSQLLSEAVQNLHAEITAPALEDLADEDEDLSLPADPTVRNFSYTVANEKLYYRENSSMVPVSTTETGEARIRGMITLRDCARRLIELQTENYPDEDIADAQAELNRLYDAYTKKYGILASRGNEMAFGEDSSYPLLCSLEEVNDKGEFVRKAAMFTKRTIKPHVPVTSVDTSVEALAVSISEKARVDMEYMTLLSGKTAAEIESDLSGIIFRDIKCATNPELLARQNDGGHFASETAGALESPTGAFIADATAQSPKAFVEKEKFALVPADEYLSGNVREKLTMAKALYEVLPDTERQWLAPNIAALQAVQPVELTAGEISVRLGATWIPPAIYKQFMHELLGTGENGKKKIEVLYMRHTGEWHVTNKSADYGNVKVFSTYGTLRASAYQILEQSLNLKDVRIFDTKTVEGKEVRVLNAKETQIAQDRQEAIKGAFGEWLWKDIDRREAMCKLYNETFNSIRPREYDGRHITFVGMNPEYTLEPHQINAVARGLYGGNSLLAHCVGAGKTFEMVALAMESKRLGLCAKSLFTVPNHIIGQFAAEWLQLYPSANLLVATKKDFEAKNRKKFCARISTGDYDAVIIGHSQSERIPMSPERQERMMTAQMQELSFSITEAKNADCPRYTIKQLEKSRKALQTKLEILNDQTRKDDAVCFEELGVDRLFVDESHNFKNLFLTTKMRNVGGIAQTDAKNPATCI